MKKLVGAMLWFCAATLLAQSTVLMLSYLRGNLGPHTLPQVVALLNGIDIQGQRLQQAIRQAKDAPPPSHEEILTARAQMSLELDARERALARHAEQLRTTQAKLQEDMAAFDNRRLAFEEDLARRNRSEDEQTLGEVQKIIELLQPEQAKDQLLRMIDADQSEDVVAIVKALPDDKRKKIIAEFTQPDEATKLQDILRLIREGVGLGPA